MSLNSFQKFRKVSDETFKKIQREREIIFQGLKSSDELFLEYDQGSQNRSPGSSVKVPYNLNWLRKTEINYLSLILIGKTKDDSIFEFQLAYEVIEKWERRKILSKKDQLIYYILLEKFSKGKIGPYRLERLFELLSPQYILGLIRDPKMYKVISRRLRPRIVYRSKPRERAFHRGYRDHGTATSDHEKNLRQIKKEKPLTEDFLRAFQVRPEKFTELQKEKIKKGQWSKLFGVKRLGPYKFRRK